jgi:flagellar hook-basal body complex protein FliE
MSTPIGKINRIVPGLIEKTQPNRFAEEAGGQGNFSDLLGKMVDSVNSLQNDAAAAQELVATGEAADLHEVMISMEKAGVAMDLLLEVRNRLVDAYQSLVKMPM